ncbi:MAG: CBS domain-containing protein [Spirochaetales bacterium]|nr:CBS domain-containing protein [Spirochaetales bacterium]
MPKSYAPRFVAPDASLNLPLVRDLMIKKVISLTPEMEIHAAMELLIKNKISGAPVIARNGSLLGMLTERDCIRMLKAELMHSQDVAHTVADCMNADIPSIEPDKNILEAAAYFVEKNMRRIPVVEKNKVIGQVHRTEVLKYMARLRKG